MPRRIFTAQPVAMARIPLRPYSAAGASGRGLLAEGVYLASRDFSDATSAGGDRVRATWRAYDLRSRFRTTPHGVFVGVAEARLNARTAKLRLGHSHRAVTTPSPGWLMAAAGQLLLEEPALLSSLTLSTTNLVTRRNGRLEAEHPAPTGAELGSVKETEVSRWLMRTCAEAVPAAGVLSSLADRYPAADEEDIRRAVRDMVRAGLLLCDLLPDDLRDDPLQHLLHRLPGHSRTSVELRRLRTLLNSADGHPPGAAQRRALLSAARAQADSVHRTAQPLVVDCLADSQLALPPAVGQNAALAASVLWHISHRKPALTHYHRRFSAKYGRHRLVPLLELLDPAVGLGPPGSHDSVGTAEELSPTRAAALATLLSDALHARATEVVLQERHLDQLAHGSALPPPRTAEIHLQLLTGTAQEPSVAVSPGTGSQNGGAAPGRWARWLPSLVPPEPADEGSGPMIAEIVCRPRSGTPGAVTAETGAPPWRIPVGVATRPGDLLLEELAVTTTGTHLVLWSTRHHRPVTPVLYSRVAPRLLPTAAHVLHLLGHAGSRPWHPWSWGPLAMFPFTPRVRYRHIVLSPARWQLPQDLAASADDRRAFFAQLDAWRKRCSPAPPDTVLVAETDRCLPVSLLDQDERELLRRSVHRGTRTLLGPLGPPDALAALPGPEGQRHLLELVVPLRRRGDPIPVPDNPRRARRAAHSTPHMPGGSWLSAALTGPAEQDDASLRALTPVLEQIAREPGIDRWFWLRYDSPALGPHLRLRFHGQPLVLASRVQPELARVTRRLRQLGLRSALHLEPYDPESERYGGAQAINAAELLFRADSHFALIALRQPEDQRLLIAAASALNIATALAPDQPRTALAPGRLRPEERRRRDALRPASRRFASAAQHEALAVAAEERHQALVTYRGLVPAEQRAQCASDIIHMSANRLLGTNPGHEQIARTLAVDSLLRR